MWGSKAGARGAGVRGAGVRGAGVRGAGGEVALLVTLLSVKREGLL